MGKQERRAYLEAIRARYRRAARAGKSAILNEFCAVCGYHRKYALRLLGAQHKRGKMAHKPGPVSLAAAVSVAAATPSETSTPEAAKPEDKDAPKAETRVVVVGDSDFASNGVLGIQGNRDLFMNVVGWLSQQENLISIRPKEASDRRLTLTATQQSNVIWMSLLIVPGLIFGTGILTWWRRR